ncbi:uncharacterized protein P174DRAFT_430478 [Aspergillus novofumigatus IBT 16806]|uniref:Uncharacterized protein n=1 Tax=Aspergillus novofumigatus (strain IBT 16806) TaxID=1392255 RepID=A0A2I1CF37_ASPN1|nr:uncharacterized protein P174DRAFT_430478 [Aspergillus novofumigatus IBT 16806]PKX96208.1 hypothetical protein P174DRAFT_430478 [Aspergillus novofumigatus IBT 16806]
MAPRKAMADTPTQQILSDNVSKRKRPETDYERWQREQDQSYRPGEQPQYGPPNEYQTDDFVLDGSDEVRHGQHHVEDRPISHGYFISSKAPAKPITSEDSIIPTARKASHLGNETFLGSLLLFAVLLMILFGAAKSIKRGRRYRTLPRSDGPRLEGKQSL